MMQDFSLVEQADISTQLSVPSCDATDVAEVSITEDALDDPDLELSADINTQYEG